MKKILLFIFLFAFSQIYSQARKNTSTLYFKNGDTIRCFARISGKYIRYSNTRKGKEIKVNYTTLKYIETRNNDKLITVYYKLEKGKRTPILMERILDGPINLYRVLNVYGSSFKM